MKVARSSDAFSFYHAAGECAAAHNAQSHGVSIFRSFDESPVHFNGEHNQAALGDWMETASIPTLIEFSEDYIEPIFGKGREALILFSNDNSAAYNQVFAEAAKQLQGQILFVTSGTEQGIQQRLSEFVGVDGTNAPTIRLLHPGEDMKKFVYSGSLDTLSVHAIKNYVDEFKAGNLRPHLKSEAEPETQGPLTILVGTNFDSIVNDASKDVLVKYYAPWCGHCKSLAPVWEELANSHADNEDLVIAKFDATANEVEGLSIRGYPTLRFYPKDNKQGYEYEGDRDIEAFQTWLQEHSSAARDHKAKRANDEL
jgi:protein disulfide-isomerase A1